MIEDGYIADVRADFIERMGLYAQDEGMPRTAGRLFALLVFEGRPVAFGDLATGLQVSRGGISTSVRLLESWGLVRRMSIAGERQDHFELAPDAFPALLRGAVERAERAQADVDATVAALPAGTDGLGVRLRSFSDFYATLASKMSEAADAVKP